MRLRRQSAAPAVLTLLMLMSSVLPVVAAAPTPVTTAPSDLAPSDEPDAAGLQPTIHWEEAQAHANDRLNLPAGGRVTVPFRPRAYDRWKVGGVAPRLLPEGRLSGKQLREAATDAAPNVKPGPTAPDTTGPDASALPETTPGPTPTSDMTPMPEPTPEPTPEPAQVDAPVIDPGDTIPAEGISYHPSGPTTAAPVDPAAAVSPNGLRREIFGFLPYWELTDSSTTLDYAKISTIAYFGVGAAANGSLERTNKDGSTTVGWSGWTSAKLTSVINAAHKKQTRVVLTVQSFAWSAGGATKQKALLGSTTARANLARQIAAAVRDRGADGVNLDFEPIASGYADEFVLLVKKVRTELDAVAKGYQLTFDTTGYIGNYPIEAATAPGAADAIFIMGYDYRSAGSSPVGSIAPIGGPAYDITDTVKAYVARVPASKLILGVPYYGRAWSTDSSAVNAKNISGSKYGASVSVIYGTGIVVLQEHGRKYETRESVAWTAYRRETCTPTNGCVTSWRQLYMDDARTLKTKYDIVNGYGLRGAGIWALGYDGARPELWAAIGDKFMARMPFTDVHEFVAAVEWLYLEGITVGCSPTLFCPNARVTRAQMALFLDRALDLPSANSNYFDDDNGVTGEGSINALAKARITGGCGPRRFCPASTVTREQIALFLVRALKLPTTKTDYFDDDNGRSGESSINALASAGLTNGCGQRRYCPTASVTRGQMAALLFRSLAK
jgi:spore germination protein YaaH